MYIGEGHCGDLACGCAMATLTSEVIRSSPKVHAAFEKKMTQIADLVVHGLGGGSDEDRRARGWAMLGVLIGGINVVRAMKGSQVADEVANAIIAAAQSRPRDEHA